MLDKLGGFLNRLKRNYDDDSIDRLNYMYTNFIILAFAITIAAKQYVGEPLQCWVPAQFKGGWEQYVENYCFVENTFWIRMNEDIPKPENRVTPELMYYQWVPFVLAIQALMFYIPRLIWGMFNGNSGVSITAIISGVIMTKTAADHKVLKPDMEAIYKTTVQHMSEVNDYQQNKKQQTRAMWRYGTSGAGIYITSVYLICKLLYIINVVSQFFLLNRFLGPQYTFWGYGILRDLAAGIEWETSGHFPRVCRQQYFQFLYTTQVTMCDFQVRVLGNLHRWTVQCVLMINMINEKIYLFLWFWFLLVAILTILNFVYWLFLTISPNSGRTFIRRYLEVKDGITVLRLLSDNAGDLAAAAVVHHLWNSFEEKKPMQGYNEDTLEKKPLLR